MLFLRNTKLSVRNSLAAAEFLTKNWKKRRRKLRLIGEQSIVRTVNRNKGKQKRVRKMTDVQK